MYDRKQIAGKIAIGLVFFILAGLFSVVIRDALALRNPEGSLPNMAVHYRRNEREDWSQIPTHHTLRTSYKWHYLFGDAKWESPDREPWLEISPAYIDANSDLKLSFTFAPKKTAIFFVSADGSYEEIEGRFQAPSTPGVYTYRVVAQWGKNNKKEVVCFFRIQVPG